MLNIGFETKLGVKEIIDRAVAFFGPDGYKLDVLERNDSSAGFVGGGGGVEIRAAVKEGGTHVDIISREWDFQVKEFIGKVK